MFCPKCGRECKDGRFCMECGTRLPEEAVELRDAAPWRPGMACPFCGANEVDGNRCAYCGGVLVLDKLELTEQEEKRGLIPGEYHGIGKCCYLKLEEDRLIVRNEEIFEPIVIPYDRLIDLHIHIGKPYNWISFRKKEIAAIPLPRVFSRACIDPATFIFLKSDVRNYEELAGFFQEHVEKNHMRSDQEQPSYGEMERKDDMILKRRYGDKASCCLLEHDHLIVKNGKLGESMRFRYDDLIDIDFRYDYGWAKGWIYFRGKGSRGKDPQYYFSAKKDKCAYVFGLDQLVESAELYSVLQDIIDKNRRRENA